MNGNREKKGGRTQSRYGRILQEISDDGHLKNGRIVVFFTFENNVLLTEVFRLLFRFKFFKIRRFVFGNDKKHFEFGFCAEFRLRFYDGQ